jgi:DNA-binding NarL/FixJ family response regulator
MPHLNGIDALILLRQKGDRVPVVFLTVNRDANFARRALDAGASGFVLKHSAPAELLLAVRAALEGKTYFTPQLAATLGISPRTVEFHKYQMMESLGLRTNAELVHFAIEHGLVER